MANENKQNKNTGGSNLPLGLSLGPTTTPPNNNNKNTVKAAATSQKQTEKEAREERERAERQREREERERLEREEQERKRREREERERLERERLERERLEREAEKQRQKEVREKADREARIWHSDEYNRRYRRSFKRFQIRIFIADQAYNDEMIAEYIFKAPHVIDAYGNVIVDFRKELENHMGEIGKNGHSMKTNYGMVFYPANRIHYIEAIDPDTIPDVLD